MAITSESQLIDIVTISNGCSIIEEASRDYTTCANRVKEAADICSPQVLAVENKSMQQPLYDLGSSISVIESNVSTFTAQIRSVANQIYARQLEELNNYRAQQAQQQAAQTAQGTQTATEPVGTESGNTATTV